MWSETEESKVSVLSKWKVIILLTEMRRCGRCKFGKKLYFGRLNLKFLLDFKLEIPNRQLKYKILCFMEQITATMKLMTAPEK